MLNICCIANGYFAVLAVVMLMAGRADGAFKPDQVSKHGDKRWEWVDLRLEYETLLNAISHLAKPRRLNVKGK